MAAWHETKPGPAPGLWVGIAFALYLTAMLGLLGWVLYRVAFPLPGFLP